MKNVVLLAQSTDLGGAFSPERLKYALEMTVLGLCAVFAVLALLWGVLILFKLFMYDAPKKKANKNMVVNTPKVEPVVNTPAPVAKSDDDVTVAVIMAAISAYISEEQVAKHLTKIKAPKKLRC